MRGATARGDGSADIVPERDAELLAGLGEAEEGVVAVAASDARTPLEVTADPALLPSRPVSGRVASSRRPLLNLKATSAGDVALVKKGQSSG
jgi:hypothetical protein